MAARVRELNSKTWIVEGATADEVTAAVKRASASRTPIDHGGLPAPMTTMLKTMVGMTTYDSYDRGGRSGAKTHLLGPAMYQTKVTVQQEGDAVRVQRKTRGLLAPVAEVATNLGAAVEAELNR